MNTEFSTFTSITTPTTLYTADTIPPPPPSSPQPFSIQDQHGASWDVSICNNHMHTTNHNGAVLEQSIEQTQQHQHVILPLSSLPPPPPPIRTRRVPVLKFLEDELKREKEEIYRLYELINVKEQKTMKLVSRLNKYS